MTDDWSLELDAGRPVHAVPLAPNLSGWRDIESGPGISITSRPDVWNKSTSSYTRERAFDRTPPSWNLIYSRMSALHRDRLAGYPGHIEFHGPNDTHYGFEPWYNWHKCTRGSVSVSFLGISEVGYLLMNIWRFHNWLAAARSLGYKIGDLEWRFYLENWDNPERTDGVNADMSIPYDAMILAERTGLPGGAPMNHAAWLNGESIYTTLFEKIKRPGSIEELRETEDMAYLATMYDGLNAAMRVLWHDFTLRMHYERENFEDYDEPVRQEAIRLFEKKEAEILWPPTVFGNPV